LKYTEAAIKYPVTVSEWIKAMNEPYRATKENVVAALLLSDAVLKCT